VHLTEGLFLYHEGDNKSGPYGKLRIPQKYVEINISHHHLSGHTKTKEWQTGIRQNEPHRQNTAGLKIYVETRITQKPSFRRDTVAENVEFLICYKFL